MKKSEIIKLLNKIKGYYNSQFFIDDDVLNAWEEQLQNYDYEDCVEHLKEYLREYPDKPPKPHTFIRGIITKEEKAKNIGYTVQCNLCQRWMSLETYDKHYGKCLDIEYLLGIAKQKGEKYTREDLENCTQNILDKLLNKYLPLEKNIKNVIRKIGE